MTKVVLKLDPGDFTLSEKALDMLHQRGYRYPKEDVLWRLSIHNKDLVENVENLGKESYYPGPELTVFELPYGCHTYNFNITLTLL